MQGSLPAWHNGSILSCQTSITSPATAWDDVEAARAAHVPSTSSQCGGGHGYREQAEVAGDGRGQLVSEALDARTWCHRVPEQG